MAMIAVLAMTMMSIERAGAAPTGSTATQFTSRTTSRVSPQSYTTVYLNCWDRKRTPILDLASLKLSAVNADDRDNIQIPPMLERYYDPSPTTWWFDYRQDDSSDVTISFYNRFPPGSNIDLYFRASVKCLPALKRRNATRNLLDSDDLIAALQRVRERSSSTTSSFEELIFGQGDHPSSAELYFSSSSSKRGEPTSGPTWDLGDDALTLLSCDGQPTVWDDTTHTWWTKSTKSITPPAGGDPSVPIKVAFVPHHTANAPEGGLPICADFDGDGRDSLMMAAATQSGGFWTGYLYSENFYAPTAAPDPNGDDTLTYGSQSVDRTILQTALKKQGTMAPAARRLTPDAHDTPGFVMTTAGSSLNVFASGATTTSDAETVSIPGVVNTISGDVPVGADSRDASVGMWSTTSSSVDTETVNVQTYVRPVAQRSEAVPVATTVNTRKPVQRGTSTVLRETKTQSLAAITDPASIGALTKRVLVNESKFNAKNPNLSMCVDIWNGGTGTNQDCGSVATDAKFASAFRLIPTVSATGSRTGLYQLVGSGPSVDECAGVGSWAPGVRNGSVTGLFKCLPGVSTPIGYQKVITDWKVTTAEKYATTAVGTDISTLPTPPPSSVPLNFTAAGTSLRLDLDDNRTAAGTNVTVGATNTASLTQRWILADTEPAEVLHSDYWDQCNDTPAHVDTTHGTLQDCSFDDANMESFFDEVPTQSGTGTFQLQSTQLGTAAGPVCLGVPRTANDETPRLGDCAALEFTEWQWRQGSDGPTGQLQLAGTNMCLDNRNGTYSTHENTQVIGTCDSTMQSQLFSTIAHMTLARDSGAAATKSG